MMNKFGRLKHIRGTKHYLSRFLISGDDVGAARQDGHHERKLEAPRGRRGRRPHSVVRCRLGGHGGADDDLTERLRYDTRSLHGSGLKMKRVVTHRLLDM